MLDRLKALYYELHGQPPPPPAAEKSDQPPVGQPPLEPLQEPPKQKQPAENLKPEQKGAYLYAYNTNLSPEALTPREKLQAQGAQSLSNLEILCLLLGSGSREHSVGKLAAQVLPLLLEQPFTTSLERLQNIQGLGLAKSAAVIAAMELARRFPRPNIKQLNNPAAIYKQIAHFADQQENLVALNLNGACEALSIRLITRGTVNRSLLHPREVFTHAVREQAHSVIIAHNHPTGYLQPSEEDIASTRRLQEAAQILDINLLDHIIFSDTDYLSMSEHGLL